MSRRSRRGARTGVGKASIDMNSLIDLTFLLLVTFILTIPALEQGISIMLPRAKTDLLPNKNNKANTITLDVNHKIFFNDIPTTLDALEATLKGKVAEDPDPVIYEHAHYSPGGQALAVEGLLAVAARVEAAAVYKDDNRAVFSVLRRIDVEIQAVLIVGEA